MTDEERIELLQAWTESLLRIEASMQQLAAGRLASSQPQADGQPQAQDNAQRR